MNNRKYKYYAIHGHNVSGDGNGITWYEEQYGYWYGAKALSEENALKQLQPKHRKFHEYNSFFVYGAIKQFDTEEERAEFIKQIKEECK